MFHSSDDARDLWADPHPAQRHPRRGRHLGRGATAIPWELIRDPKTDTPLALRAPCSFAPTPSRPNGRKSQARSGPIRILLVICRPRADDDVPFRSVASRLIKGLSEQNRRRYHLDVLRPPTFEQLANPAAAKADGKPYHVVHFDGHGMYPELTRAGDLAPLLQHLFPIISPYHRPVHGFLLFENPPHQENVALIDGPTLGNCWSRRMCRSSSSTPAARHMPIRRPSRSPTSLNLKVTIPTSRSAPSARWRRR